MFEKLVLVQLPAGSKFPVVGDGRIFNLETCQRTLALGANPAFFNEISTDARIFTGASAYRHLLETHCGLQSRMAGEQEIVSQFKQAYSDFLQAPRKSSLLMAVLEKLFKDGKEVRSKHLSAIGQQSYAGISRRLLLQKARGKKILVVGTGHMARDLIKVMNKHFCVVVTGRNHNSVKDICMEKKLDGECWSWKDRVIQKELIPYPYIVNTVGVKEKIFPSVFFEIWKDSHGKDKTFIDLANPSPMETFFGKKDDVYRLQDILDEGVMLDKVKQEKIHNAHRLIGRLVAKRYA